MLRILRLCLTTVLLALPVGCASTQHPEVESAVADLPAYAPEQAALFDDSFSAEIFGLPYTGPDLARDRQFVERLRTADAVVRTKISTITSDATGLAQSFSLTLRRIDEPLAGQLTHDFVELEVHGKNPSVALVARHQAVLIGKTVIVFLRDFNDAGQRVTHFRAEADTESVRKAVQSAKMLDDVGS